MRTRNARWWKQQIQKLWLPRWLACLVALLLNLPWTATAQPAATNATIVEVELAKHVAAEHVNANNQPFEWRYLDPMVLCDVAAEWEQKRADWTGSAGEEVAQ